jgi:hypothetical protein
MSSVWAKRGGLSDLWRVGISGELLAMSSSADETVEKRFCDATRKDRSAEADGLSVILRAEDPQRTFAQTE